jgi:hypothetical protein
MMRMVRGISSRTYPVPYGTVRDTRGGTSPAHVLAKPVGEEDAVAVVPVRSARERFVLVLVDIVAITLAVTGAAMVAMAAVIAAIGVALVALSRRLQAGA